MHINEQTITYPGDMKVKIHSIKNADEGGWNLTGITLGSHTGSHLDSPLHIGNNRLKIADIDLTQCYGSALVLEIQNVSLGEKISPLRLKDSLPEKVSLTNKILLLKTENSTLGYSNFRKDWIALNPETAEFLKDQHIKAIGLDSLTIGDRETHEILLESSILVYEGLNLGKIVPGEYIFSGFPLKIDTEGAPVRAVLLKE